MQNFLGTYTSRYSDYDGYWLFGMLTAEIDGFEIDLLNPYISNSFSHELVTGIQLAARKFREQAERIGFSIYKLHEAKLYISKSHKTQYGYINRHLCTGNEILFHMRVVCSYGNTYESKKSLFVAPHNPLIEHRSARDN